MVFDNIFSNNTIIGSAMNASMIRNDILINNIANGDTPNFKKSDVEFETLLEKELKSARLTGGVRLSNIAPRVKVVNSNYSYRTDGNNVDVEAEMVELYKNSSKYDVMTDSLTGNYKRINLVLSSS